MRGSSAAMLAAACLTFAGGARADEDSDLCFADSIEGQVLRAHGHLIRAREHLALCARPVCEEHMRQRCAEWLTQVEPTIPVLRLQVQDDRGTSLPSAIVRLDGAVVDPASPIPVDPGPHELRADYANRRTVVSIKPSPGAQTQVVSID